MIVTMQQLYTAFNASKEIINRADLKSLALPMIQNHLAIKNAVEPVRQLLEMGQQRVKAEREKYADKDEAEVLRLVQPVVDEVNAGLWAAANESLDFVAPKSVLLEELVTDRDINASSLLALVEIGAVVV
jgi:hypothetical protein